MLHISSRSIALTWSSSFRVTALADGFYRRKVSVTGLSRKLVFFVIIPANFLISFLVIELIVVHSNLRNRCSSFMKLESRCVHHKYLHVHLSCLRSLGIRFLYGRMTWQLPGVLSKFYFPRSWRSPSRFIGPWNRLYSYCGQVNPASHRGGRKLMFFRGPDYD